MATPRGPVPLVASALDRHDRLGTLGARSGVLRNGYKVTPGLYGLGRPTQQSPVIVTANYKLTFDTVRSSLPRLDAWLLVVDTRGINVWCGAGKKTFSAEEIIYQVRRERLADVVSHRTLILPQLAAVGVSAGRLQRGCGFQGKFGPIRIADLPRYLANGMHGDEEMRSVTFTLRERAALIPVEVCLLYKQALVLLPAVVILSGVCPSLYSLHLAANRAPLLLVASMMAVITGAIVTPLCLPWIPGREFWLKGILTGIPAALGICGLMTVKAGLASSLGLAFWLVAVSSYLAMNFTGSTPYTSLSGVEREMRRGLPVQLCCAGTALILWLAGPFLS